MIWMTIEETVNVVVLLIRQAESAMRLGVRGGVGHGPNLAARARRHDEPVNNIDHELLHTADRDPIVRAWTCRHPDEVIRQAVHDAPAGPLSGWSLGVKDVIDTADLPTERGSSIYAGRTTENDAACVALARAAGATVVGKTATTEFALFTPTFTTNPHDPTRTPGGSSSGSAAAVADAQVRAAFGTQTVGSVLRPAAYCGVVGFKPTRELIPTTGVATLSHSFDTVGWLTADVGDSRTLLNALVGDAGFGTAVGPSPRIGVYRSHQWPSAQPEIVELMSSATERLTAAGLDVHEIDPLPHLENVWEAADAILHFDIMRVFAWEAAHHHDAISPLVQKMLARAAHLDTAEVHRARRLLDDARARHTDALVTAGVDVLMTPSAPGVAPPIKTTGDSVFNRLWTSLGVPTIHLPLARVGGLSIGLQFAGTHWNDHDLLDAAHSISGALSDGNSA